VPSESRIITFTKSEVFEALKDYCRQTSRPLPGASVDGLMLMQGKTIALELKPPGHESPITFAENEVAAAIMLFCAKSNIPLPRRAIKSIDVAQETLSLRLELRS
jgi:hypothetical protein